ncbi:MAG TPA: NAD(P)-dependent oxidoreductase, partial [Bacteroidales bacterium]|nr:NAD(P)-dependent oxidoreductase [Bacteroidales bacterium]
DTFLSRFRKKIWLINTSRGPVVDTSALVRHLAGGNLLGAALDVLEYEDGSFEKLTTSLPVEMKALLEADNVILSPHIAGWTKESEIKMARVLVEKIGALGSPAG